MCMQNRLPLNNLNTFAAAAENLSFQKAAESLYVTPSAVSHQVRNLEQILGYKLFDRLDKKVKLTAQGERLFNDIRVPIKQLHEAGRKAFRGLEDNALALSVAPVFVTGWLLPRLKDFYACHPDINLSVIATTDMIDFDSDPFDASIRMGKGDWKNLLSYRLFNREIVAVCHPALLMANKKLKANKKLEDNIKLKATKKLFTPLEISNHSLVSNSSMPGLWEEWFQSAKIEIPDGTGVKLQVQNSAQVVEVLQTGDSIGLIDRNFIISDIKSGRLTIACEHVLQGDKGYYLTAPKSAEILPSFQTFKNWLGTHSDIVLKVSSDSE